MSHRRFRILSGVVLSTAGLWAIGGLGLADAASPPPPTVNGTQVVFGGQPGFGGYTWRSVNTTSMGAQWTLPQPTPVTTSELTDTDIGGQNGGLSVWIGVEGDTWMPQTATYIHELLDLQLGQPNPQYPNWENANNPLTAWNAGVTPADRLNPGDPIGAYLLQTGPRTWRAWLEDLNTHRGWTALITGSTTGQNAAPSWMYEIPNNSTLPVQPTVGVSTMDRMTLNGSAINLWSIAPTQEGEMFPGGNLEQAASDNPNDDPTDMTVSNPNTTGDGFSIQDGTVAPAPPAANPTPGESIDVVFPSAWRQPEGGWNFTAQPGTALTILGGGFGTSGTVTWNGIALPVTSWAEGVITVTLPTPVAPGSSDLTVTPTDGVPTLWGSSLTVLPAGPTWNAPTAPVSAQSTLTLTGTNLGTSGTARWRGRFPWTVVAWTPTAVTVDVPPKANGSGSLMLTPSGQASQALPLTIVQSILTASTSTVRANTTVTLTGTNLGTNGTARWRGRFPWTVTAWSPTSVTVRIPVTAHGIGKLWLVPTQDLALAVRLDITPANGLGNGAG